MAIGRLMSIALDCDEPQQLADFWAQLLGGRIGFASENFVAVGLESGMWLGAYRVPGHEAPRWPDGGVPKQFHLDVAVDDLDAAEHDALDLGATKPDHQPQPDRWRVLLDPAGHPFCVSVQVPEVADVLATSDEVADTAAT